MKWRMFNVAVAASYHLLRDHGWYSNKMRGRRAQRVGHVRNGDTIGAPEPPSRTSVHWQRLIRNVYEADPRKDRRFSMDDC
ncbi:MAG TPA: hypothetical protein PLU30_20280 [Verrucomicrobiae bacterium]|nr:hypothetical protein [Verrucomicrobiae bacterium]